MANTLWNDMYNWNTEALVGGRETWVQITYIYRKKWIVQNKIFWAVTNLFAVPVQIPFYTINFLFKNSLAGLI